MHCKVACPSDPNFKSNFQFDSIFMNNFIHNQVSKTYSIQAKLGI